MFNFIKWARKHGYINNRGHYVGGNAALLHYLSVMAFINSFSNSRISNIDATMLQRTQKPIQKFLNEHGDDLINA